MAWSWEKSSLNPKNWGSGGGSSTSSIDTDTAVSNVINEGGTRTYTGGIVDDLTMGLSTIGLTGDKQAEKLKELGYAPGAIEDFQSRTEETRQSMITSGGNDDDGPRTTVTAEPEEEEATDEVAPVDIVAEVPEAPSTVRRRRPPPPPKPDPVYKGRRIEPPAGQTESEAMEAGQRGRKSTIATSPTGLLDEPEVRRRSLMGGLIS